MYIINEYNEKRGFLQGKKFEKLKDAISYLDTQKYVARKYGRIIREIVKSFTWVFQDEHNTEYKSTIKIEKE
jgi:hypothetical protein